MLLHFFGRGLHLDSKTPESQLERGRVAGGGDRAGRQWQTPLLRGLQTLPWACLAIPWAHFIPG